jgi:hypothetical protein
MSIQDRSKTHIHICIYIYTHSISSSRSSSSNSSYRRLSHLKSGIEELTGYLEFIVDDVHQRHVVVRHRVAWVDCQACLV